MARIDWRDRWLWAAVGVAVVLRALPLLIWGGGGCVRDECTYLHIANQILAGEGMAIQQKWLWAPGYPYVLAFFIRVTGSAISLKIFQVALGAVAVMMMDHLGRRLFDPRTGRFAAWLFALHPTFAFFAGTLWSETLYATLLMGLSVAFLWSRDGSARRGILVGFFLGICILFRGVATYMSPIFFLGLLWPEEESWREAVIRRWRHVAVAVLTMILVVSPYSIHASQKYGGRVLSDATLGQMMWLGNNDFEPVTFDYGNGRLGDAAMRVVMRQGRRRCKHSLPPVQWDKCETEKGLKWIQEHPQEFIRRMPMRVAQMLNPHTFLTRHIRMGKWRQLPYELKEILTLWVVFWSYLVVLGGTVAGIVRGRGAFAVVAGLTVLYHIAAISVLAGLSRYRLPLEPFAMLYLAAVFASPRSSLVLVKQPWRAVGALVVGAVVLWLLSWYVMSGFPGFY